MTQIPPDMRPGWHLDKRVPIALIFAIAMQTGAAIWWIAKTEARIQHLEETAANRSPLVSRFLTVEANQLNLANEVRARLDRIETKVDRLFEQGRYPNRTRP